MIGRTYISKFNTIVKDSDVNTGLNPVSELLYGAHVTRALIYFDHNEIKKLIDDGTYGDVTKLTHTLKITNAGSIDFSQMHLKEYSSIDSTIKQRASSFDLIFFLIPLDWDGGKGYSYCRSYFDPDTLEYKATNHGEFVSFDACNWYQRRNGYKWDNEGIFTNEYLSEQYAKWADGEESIVIGRQRFDIGNENINLDITDVVNKFINGELENNGIGIAFSPLCESTELLYEEYVGFLTHKTNTLYAPFVETKYDNFISDDRNNFVLNKTNKLYLYSNIGGKLTDLDMLPTCSILDQDGNTVFDNLEVKHYSQGVYYVEVMCPQSDFKADQQYFDTWDGLVYQNTQLEPVELYFTIKPASNFFNIGNGVSGGIDFTPQVSGINDRERIKRGDKRKLNITARVNYTQKQSMLIDEIDFRLYVLDGKREVTIFDYDGVNKTTNENYVIIDTSMLLPQVYHVDIRIKYGMENILHHDILQFEIVNELQSRYL